MIYIQALAWSAPQIGRQNNGLPPKSEDKVTSDPLVRRIDEIEDVVSDKLKECGTRAEAFSTSNSTGCALTSETNAFYFCIPLLEMAQSHLRFAVPGQRNP